MLAISPQAWLSYSTKRLTHVLSGQMRAQPSVSIDATGDDVKLSIATVQAGEIIGVSVSCETHDSPGRHRQRALP
jgi:hypothetical protein